MGRITADATATAARMKTDAKHLGDLGREAKEAVAKAGLAAHELLGQLLEGASKVVAQKVDEVGEQIRAARDQKDKRRP